LYLALWCRGEGIDPDYAIIVRGIPEETDVSKIEESMHSFKALGRVRVRGRMFSQESQSLIVLCECREKVQAERLPLDVLPADGSEPWILSANRMEGTDLDGGGESFVSPDESGQREEHQESNSPNLLNASTPESIIRALGDLLAKTTKISSDSSSFRRLRTFSGITPTPAGEGNLENWMEQAMLMVEESDRSEKEKKLRIEESSSGKVYKLRSISKRVSCIRRRSVFQSCTKRRPGLPSQLAGKARLEQLIRGAIQADIMLLQLRLRERKENPPDFLDLQHEIREEEVREAERRKANPTVRQVQIGSENSKDSSF
uniref:RRM domain-containing protein n=1 Tax=Sinocyclocheilus grahami TaxID=75366 RepID=A0A672MUU6_SINGR